MLFIIGTKTGSFLSVVVDERAEHAVGVMKRAGDECGLDTVDGTISGVAMSTCCDS